MTSAITETKKTTWKADPAHTNIGFTAKHMMITTVRGRFNKYDVNLQLDDNDPTKSRVEATIDAASLFTGEERRDGHLRSGDFLEAGKYPNITFKSKWIERVGADEYRVVGDLTIRDVTREIALDTTFEGRGVNPYGIEVASFNARTQINRKDFGLTWNVALETGGVLVSEVVKIELEVQAHREK